MHAAAWVDPGGTICAAREDAGRHVALDKLIGHGLRAGLDPASAAILMSSRCSYELVQKTVRLGAPLLITVSAATDLAVQLASTAGLSLIALARRDAVQVMHDPAGVYGPTTTASDNPKQIHSRRTQFK
jgi:FdhD protein